MCQYAWPQPLSDAMVSPIERDQSSIVRASSNEWSPSVITPNRCCPVGCLVGWPVCGQSKWNGRWIWWRAMACEWVGDIESLAFQNWINHDLLAHSIILAWEWPQSQNWDPSTRFAHKTGNQFRCCCCRLFVRLAMATCAQHWFTLVPHWIDSSWSRARFRLKSSDSQFELLETAPSMLRQTNKLSNLKTHTANRTKQNKIYHCFRSDFVLGPHGICYSLPFLLLIQNQLPQRC